MDNFDDRLFDTDPSGVLKIPTVLWLGLMIHTRHWVLLFLILASLAVGATNTLAAIDLKSNMWMALIQLPSLLVLIAGALRQPDAKGWVRAIWANGPRLMATTAVVNVAFVGMWLTTSATWSRWPELYLVSTAFLDLAVAYWAISQALPRQVFSEFPKH